MTSEINEKDARIQKLEKIIADNTCSFCNDFMCPHQNHNRCKFCNKNVCFFCTSENFNYKLDMCKKCSKDYECQLCEKFSEDMKKCLACGHKHCKECLEDEICLECLDDKKCFDCCSVGMEVGLVLIVLIFIVRMERFFPMSLLFGNA